MRYSITFTAFVGLVSTAAGQYFGVIAAHSASPIHLLEWNASGQRIWLDKNTTSYCPLSDATGCPKGTTTNFAAGDGTLAMGSEVPGGQLVYIDPACGAVMYTQAHSATMPEGAILTGWDWDQGASYGFLAWKNGLLACSSSGDPDEGPWEIYAQLDGIKFGEGCIGLDATTLNETGPAAWQYI